MMRLAHSAPTLIIGLGHHPSGPSPEEEEGGGDAIGMIDLPEDFDTSEMQPGDEFVVECHCRLSEGGKAEVTSVEKQDGADDELAE